MSPSAVIEERLNVEFAERLQNRRRLSLIPNYPCYERRKITRRYTRRPSNSMTRAGRHVRQSGLPSFPRHMFNVSTCSTCIKSDESNFGLANGPYPLVNGRVA